MTLVLFLSPVPPWPPRSGGKLRTLELLRAMRGLADVHLWAVEEPGSSKEAMEALSETCASVRLFPRSSAPRWKRIARTRPERWFHSEALAEALGDERAMSAFDLVHADESCMVRAIPRTLRAPLVVHHHKLDRELARALGRAPWERIKVARLEAHAAARTRHHVVCSREDAERLRARHPALHLSVVESGVDLAYFAPAPLPRDPDRLLFLGSLAYEPNLDALEHCVREILPRVRAERPCARLRVVGERPAERARSLAAPGVDLVGELPDVREELARAALLLAPLRIGGGSRLKIVSALAAGCPVVATRIAIEGLALEHGAHVSLADEPAAYARAVLEALADPVQTSEVARRGRERVLELYSWDRLARALLASWESAVREFAPVSAARTGSQPSSPWPHQAAKAERVDDLASRLTRRSSGA